MNTELQAAVKELQSQLQAFEDKLVTFQIKDPIVFELRDAVTKVLVRSDRIKANSEEFHRTKKIQKEFLSEKLIELDRNFQRKLISEELYNRGKKETNDALASIEASTF